MDDIAHILDADEARSLTDEIRGAAERVYQLLMRAYEGKAWKALGYGSWREYAMAEFDMSQSRAYQLLDQARVVREIEESAVSPIGENPASDSTNVELPNEAQARELAKAPEGQRAQVWEQVQQDTESQPTAAAVRQAVHPTPAQVAPPTALGIDEYWDPGEPEVDGEEPEPAEPAPAKPARAPRTDVVGTISALLAKTEDAGRLADQITPTHMTNRKEEATVWARRLDTALEKLQRLNNTFKENQ